MTPRSLPSLWAVGITLIVLSLAFVSISQSFPGQDSVDDHPGSGGIANLMKVSASVICGAEPVGSSDFAELKELGVRTVLSVDGAVPDVEAAKLQGLRYVHIPIGYDGLPAEAVQMMTRVMRDCERPVFVHCHHGKHRGPAAAALCAIAAGEINNEGGLRILEEAGTSRDYAGLWRDVEGFMPLPPNTALPPLVEAAAPEPLVESMLRMDDLFEQLIATTTDAPTSGKSSGAAAQHPHPRAAELAVLLKEQFHESARLRQGEVADDLQLQMLAAEEAAAAIADAARKPSASLSERIDALRETCRDCHRQHRN